MRRAEALDGQLAASRPARAAAPGARRAPCRIRCAIGERLAEDDALAPRAALDEPRRRARPRAACARAARGARAGGRSAAPARARAARPSPTRAARATRAAARPGRRGRSGVSRPRARSWASRPGRPKRSATAPRGSAASSPSVAIPSRSSGSTSAAVSARRRSSATGRDARSAAPAIRSGRRTRAPCAATIAQKRVGPCPMRAPGEHPAQALGAVRGEVAVGEHPHDAAGVQPLQPARVEARLARAQRLDRRAEALQPRERALPRLGDAHRVGRHERQPRAARSASPIRIPAWIPNASAACETSPTNSSRPGSGASAAGSPSSPARPPAATASSKRSSRTQTIMTNTCSHRSHRGASSARASPDRLLAAAPAARKLSVLDRDAGAIDVRQPDQGPLAGLPLRCRRARRHPDRRASRTRSASRRGRCSRVAAVVARAGARLPAARRADLRAAAARRARAGDGDPQPARPLHRAGDALPADLHVAGAVRVLLLLDPGGARATSRSSAPPTRPCWRSTTRWTRRSASCSCSARRSSSAC